MVQIPWEDPNMPLHPPAWNIANKHCAAMARANPPKLPKPKDPTPTLKDLKPKNEYSVRCFSLPFHREIRKEAALLESCPTSPGFDPTSTSFSKKETKNGLDSHRSLQSDLAATTLLWTKQRNDAIAAKRQQEDHRRLLALQSKLRSNAAAKEDNFLATYGKLQSEHETFVAEIDKYLNDKGKAHQQKMRTLHSEWKECVFDKIQMQILNRVEDMDAEEIGKKRRQLFQNYIDAARRKGGRLFLDIVIENEYDPFTWKKDNLKYRDKPALVSNGPGFTDRFGNPIFDPSSRDLDKLKSEARAAQEVAGGPVSNHTEKLGREMLSHEHWAKMEATPFYDRAAKVQDAMAAGKKPKVRAGMQSKVDLNDYEFPQDQALLAKEFQGLYGLGKRVWKDWQPGQTRLSASTLHDGNATPR